MSKKNHPQFYPHVLQNLFYSTFVEQISISFFLFLSVYQQVNTYYMPFIHLLPRDEKDFAQQIKNGQMRKWYLLGCPLYEKEDVSK